MYTLYNPIAFIYIDAISLDCLFPIIKILDFISDYTLKKYYFQFQYFINRWKNPIH